MTHKLEIQNTRLPRFITIYETNYFSQELRHIVREHISNLVRWIDHCRFVYWLASTIVLLIPTYAHYKYNKIPHIIEYIMCINDYVTSIECFLDS